MSATPCQFHRSRMWLQRIRSSGLKMTTWRNNYKASSKMCLSSWRTNSIALHSQHLRISPTGTLYTKNCTCRIETCRKPWWKWITCPEVILNCMKKTNPLHYTLLTKNPSTLHLIHKQSLYTTPYAQTTPLHYTLYTKNPSRLHVIHK